MIAAIKEHDLHPRGIVVLGLDAPEEELAASFRVADGPDLVRDFAVGRAIFGEVARQWFQDAVSDESAIDDMAARSASCCAIRNTARGQARSL